MSRRKPGRKVTRYEWLKDGLSVEVLIKVVDRTKKKRIGMSSQKEDMIFAAYCDEADLSFEDTDINELRNRMDAALDEWHAVEWEPHLLIEVSGTHPDPAYARPAAFLQIEWEAIVVGTHRDGSKAHMKVPLDSYEVEDGLIRWSGTRFSGHSPREGLPELGPNTGGHFNTFGGHMRSLVKATPERLAALQRFRQAMIDMGRRVTELFAPDNVEQVLDSQTPYLLATASREEAT
ncbi:MAG: hypothetical protein PVH68_05605 [Armatimonadota bacterium]|jgi:hypothetical protein